MQNPYQTLGVDRNVSADEIKRAYRKLSLQYHPDRNPSPEAQPKFQAINEANEILGDPGRRQQYDNELNGGGARMDMMNGQEFRDINHIFNSFFGGGGHGPGILRDKGEPSRDAPSYQLEVHDLQAVPGDQDQRRRLCNLKW